MKDMVLLMGERWETTQFQEVVEDFLCEYNDSSIFKACITKVKKIKRKREIEWIEGAQKMRHRVTEMSPEKSVRKAMECLLLCIVETDSVHRGTGKLQKKL